MPGKKVASFTRADFEKAVHAHGESSFTNYYAIQKKKQNLFLNYITKKSLASLDLKRAWGSPHVSSPLLSVPFGYDPVV